MRSVLLQIVVVFWVLSSPTLPWAAHAPPIFPRMGIDLLSWLPLPDLDSNALRASDCWGYTSGSGREYALVGLSTGTAFVEVTDPGDAQLVSLIAGPTSDWRDIKVYGHHAYAVSEGGGGIQVFDLSQIDSGSVVLANTVLLGGRTSTHNVAIDEESGFLYRAGGGFNNPPLGLRIYDLSDPQSPSFVGDWNDRYCHDAQVVTWSEAPYAGVEVAFCYSQDTTTGGNPGIDILDVSIKTSVTLIGSINLSLPSGVSHPALYSHQGWLSHDRRYVYHADEADESGGTLTTTRVIDVSDLANPVLVSAFTNGTPARDHNLYTLGERIFEANYTSGLRVFDARDPLQPFEFAFFDTYPQDNAPSFKGLWGVYPYFPSGTVIGSDVEKGLFVWRIDDAIPVPVLPPGLRLLLGVLLLVAGGSFWVRRRR